MALWSTSISPDARMVRGKTRQPILAHDKHSTHGQHAEANSMQGIIHHSTGSITSEHFWSRTVIDPAVSGNSRSRGKQNHVSRHNQCCIHVLRDIPHTASLVRALTCSGCVFETVRLLPRQLWGSEVAQDVLTHSKTQVTTSNLEENDSHYASDPWHIQSEMMRHA
jgi:hypothetical protein